MFIVGPRHIRIFACSRNTIYRYVLSYAFVQVNRFVQIESPSVCVYTLCSKKLISFTSCNKMAERSVDYSETSF